MVDKIKFVKHFMHTPDKNRKVHWRCSSVLPPLAATVFAVTTFRDYLLHQKHFEDRGLTLSLCSIVTQKRKVGTIAPKKFIARLRKEKIEFDNYMQQVPEQIVEVLE